MRNRFTAQLVFVGLSLAAMPAFAQDMPADYASVLKTLGKQGDYKDNVLKVNIPRSDLQVSVDGIATPTPFGFGGWITIGRDDLPLKEMGASINSRMGLNTWAAFYGGDTDAVVAGDVAMRSRHRGRRHPPSHDDHAADGLFPPLLGARACTETRDGCPRGPRPARQERREPYALGADRT